MHGFSTEIFEELEPSSISGAIDLHTGRKKATLRTDKS